MSRLRPPIATAVFILTVVSTAAAQAGEEVVSPRAESALITGVPHVEQRPDFCGEACAEMWLRKLGHPIDQDQVFALAGIDPSLGRGAVTDELRRALVRLGFDPGPVWRAIDPRRGAEGVEESWRALHADLLRGVPSIVCMHYSDAPETTEHFRLVLGYDAATDEVVYHEPAEQDGAYRRMPRPLFLKLWTFKPRRDRWTTIRLKLEGTKIQAPAPERGISEATYAQRVLTLKEKVKGERFTVVVERPFVVIGDGNPAEIKARAAETVRWTRDLLLKDFFSKDPDELIDIWVFWNEKSYRRHAKQLFGDDPDTPYGYYSAEHHALVMNIGPGYGTLVHEVVHPYMRANFPDCPAWINEGLASLYERPVERKGHLAGLVNWRLPGLKAAIRAKNLPTLEALAKMDERTFYDDDGSHYAEARYILYTLQERGRLVDFIRQAIAGRARDPSGYQALRRALGEPDMAAFQKQWEAEMLRL